MSAVFKKEFRSNLMSITGILFIVIMLFVLNWNFILVQLYAKYPNVSFTFVNFYYIKSVITGGVPLLTLILASMLTMKTFPEERHQKTDILLYSLPIGAGKVVMGKYLALVSVFALPFIEFLCFPVIASAYGTVNFAQAYGTIAAYFLLGCAVIAVCMFLSSLTSSQVICAVMGIAAVLAIYFVPQLANVFSDTPATALGLLIVLTAAVAAIVYFSTNNPVVALITFGVLGAAEIVIYIVKSDLYEGLAGRIFNSVALFDKLSGFANGTVDIGAYIYFISFAALFVFFTVQSFEKRRWN